MHRLRLLSVIVALTAACSGGASAVTTGPGSTDPGSTVDSTPTSSPASTTTRADDPAFPVTVTDGSGRPVVVESQPNRIAALSSVHVEMLFAIGAGPQVVAGDLFTNYPPEAAGLVQLDSFNLSIESVIELDPDLVVLSFDPGEAVAGLTAVGIPTLLLGTAADLRGTYEQLRVLGAASGHREAAEAVVDEMVVGIAEVVATVGSAGDGLTFYHETDPFDYYTPSSQSFIGRLYSLLGMQNIADAAPDEFGSGFPQLSPEFILEADPQLVFLASFGEDATTLANRAGWDTLTAVRQGAVYELDPDVASRWGPRVVELLGAIGRAVLDHRGGSDE